MKKLIAWIIWPFSLFLTVIKPVYQAVSNYQDIKGLQTTLPQFFSTLQSHWQSNWVTFGLFIVSSFLLLDSYFPSLKHLGQALKMSYDTDKYPDCCVLTKNFNNGQDCTVFRIKVDAQGCKAIRNCQGYLVSVEREINGRWVKDINYTEQLILAWAIEGDAPKDIRPQVSSYLDVVFLTPHQEISLGTQGQSYPASVQDLFESPGRYKMHIVVSPLDDNVRTQSIDIIMERIGTPINNTRLYKA